MVGNRYTSVLGRIGEHPEGALQDLILCQEVHVITEEVLPTRCSVHLALVTQVLPLVLTLDEDSKVIETERKIHHLGTGVVELCAGSGAMGSAMAFLGAKPLLAWDHSAVSVRHLKENQHGKVIHGCVSDLHALKEAHMCLEHQSFVGTLGFPCQPYSTQGRGRGSADARFHTLPTSLKNFCVLNPQALITECVGGASQNAEVRQALSEFCRIMNFQMKDIHLNLRDQWPMARARWWVIMAPPEWSNYELMKWKVMEKPMLVGDLFPQWAWWPLHHERDLLPTAQEMEDLFDKKHGSDRRILTQADVCATVLHSYAVTHEPCPCGCRVYPFSSESLACKGLRGFLVKSPTTNQLRYLHPKELAGLMGISLNMKFEQPMKSSLCLLGNAASPIQCLWVYGHLVQGAAKFIPLLRGLQPEVILDRYRCELISQCRGLVDPDEEKPMWLEIKATDGESIRLWAQGTATIAQLLKAEHIALEWGHTQHLMEGSLRLPEELKLVYMQEVEGELERKPKKQKTERPMGTLVIGVVHGDQLHMEFLNVGSFLFEALRKMGLMQVNWVSDEQGVVYSADLRVWESQRFFTLHEPSFPILTNRAEPFHDERRAAGHSEELEGLGAQILGKCMRHLLSQVYGNDEAVVLVQPFWLEDLNDSEWPFDEVDFVRRWKETDGFAVLPIAHDRHWLLVMMRCEDQQIVFTHLDGWLRSSPTRVTNFLARIASLVDTPFGWVETHCEVPQVHSNTCGTVMIAHLCHCLGLTGHFGQDQILQLHRWLVQHDTWHERKANGPDLSDMLAELLTNKGVKKADAKTRANAAIESIGARVIQSALVSKNPWAALKAAANKPNVAFKFVHSDELQEHIQWRAKNEHGANHMIKHKEKGKKKGPQPLDIAAIDPLQIKLMPGHFVNSENEEIDQIPMTAVVKDAVGIAVCKKVEATPFLSASSMLSSSPLALLIVDDLRDAGWQYAKVVKIRFSALYTATNEPVILSGWLLQIGDEEVKKRANDDPMKGEGIIQTSVLKILMFRDEVECDWDWIVNNPIRTLMKLAPKFQLCRETACGQDCLGFHSPVDEDMEKVIHEIWGRRFQSIQGVEINSKQAELFVAFLRVQQCAFEELIGTQVRGLYVEPRANDVKGASKDYVVIWLSDDRYEDAQHRLRITEHAVSLARAKMRYGVRVKATNEEQAYRSLKPQQEYVKVNIQCIYKLHPLPFGLQRVSIQKLLKEWKWTARPLQPTRGSSMGGAWTVGSEVPPPQPILVGFGQDVLITCLKQKTAANEDEHLVVPRKTQAYLRQHKETSSSSTSAKQDPWMLAGNDPWQNWQPKSNMLSKAATAPVQARIDEVTNELKANMKSYIQEELQQTDGAASGSSGKLDAYQSSADRRLNKLETGMQELQVQNTKFQAWFQETGTRLQSSEQQLQIMSSALETTNADVRTVKQEVQASSEAMKGAFEGMQASLSKDLDSKLSGFADRMEGMLGKRRALE